MSIEKILKPVVKAVEKLEQFANSKQKEADYNETQEDSHRSLKEDALLERDKAARIRAKIVSFLED